ncbi:phosphotransferase [Paenibacillus alkalitolerans]|uniref:phosphotransferase n=1 Tax=Paenibacillus alkalitolerans TaxID=2799335 RepID=UPI0018F6108B|nr:phosphotransferase [Paenibacillus alkalitolerans]
MHDALLTEIIDTIKKELGIAVHSSESIRRGYLNEKWILETNKGTLFAKSYHPHRYRNHLSTIWDEIAAALRLQMIFHQSGGLCPRLYCNEEQSYLHAVPSGRKFVLMEFQPGEMVTVGQVNELQMYSLGMTTAEMHNAWNPSDEGMQGVNRPEEPVWKLDKTKMIQSWYDRWEQVKTASLSTRYALQLQRDVLDQLDDHSFAESSPGWTHLDLWVDNLLFAPDRLSAIVDFDRIRYSFPLLDIGRAILSCSLSGGIFRQDIAAAFAEGYRKIRPLPKRELLNGVRHCWLIESFWWLRPSMELFSTAPKRFAEEMIWTAAQWDSLEKVLGEI